MAKNSIEADLPACVAGRILRDCKLYEIAAGTSKVCTSLAAHSTALEPRTSSCPTFASPPSVTSALTALSGTT